MSFFSSSSVWCKKFELFLETISWRSNQRFYDLAIDENIHLKKYCLARHSSRVPSLAFVESAVWWRGDVNSESAIRVQKLKWNCFRKRIWKIARNETFNTSVIFSKRISAAWKSHRTTTHREKCTKIDFLLSLSKLSPILACYLFIYYCKVFVTMKIFKSLDALRSSHRGKKPTVLGPLRTETPCRSQRISDLVADCVGQCRKAGWPFGTDSFRIPMINGGDSAESSSHFINKTTNL